MSEDELERFLFKTEKRVPNKNLRRVFLFQSKYTPYTHRTETLAAFCGMCHPSRSDGFRAKYVQILEEIPRFARDDSVKMNKETLVL